MNLGDPRWNTAKPHERLTARELAVFVGMAKGLLMKQIAADMNLSIKTISTYVTRMKIKTGIHQKYEIICYCISHGLIPNPAEKSCAGEHIPNASGDTVTA